MEAQPTRLRTPANAFTESFRFKLMKLETRGDKLNIRRVGKELFKVEVVNVNQVSRSVFSPKKTVTFCGGRLYTYRMEHCFRMCMCRSKNKVCGFSLLDLLVVLGMVFLLACLLLPAVSIARQRSQSEHCLHNLHELSLAWLMFADANSDVSIGSISGGGPPNQTWSPPSLDWTVNSQNTNVTPLRSGPLYPYLGGEVTPFNCPANTFLSPAQVAAGFKTRNRSYSMNMFFGWAQLFSPNRNLWDPTYRQFLKTTDVPNPSSFYVFAEEDPDTINDGNFVAGIFDYPTFANSFIDLPASYHAGAAGFSFADGHCEMHHWLDPRQPGNPGAGISGLPVFYGLKVNESLKDTSPYLDSDWIENHSSAPIQP
jgi:prepilin-type processing-associated H-X9-DG protein